MKWTTENDNIFKIHNYLLCMRRMCESERKRARITFFCFFLRVFCYLNQFVSIFRLLERPLDNKYFFFFSFFFSATKTANASDDYLYFPLAMDIILRAPNKIKTQTHKQMPYKFDANNKQFRCWCCRCRCGGGGGAAVVVDFKYN